MWTAVPEGLARAWTREGTAEGRLRAWGGFLTVGVSQVPCADVTPATAGVSVLASVPREGASGPLGWAGSQACLPRAWCPSQPPLGLRVAPSVGEGSGM